MKTKRAKSKTDRKGQIKGCRDTQEEDRLTKKCSTLEKAKNEKLADKMETMRKPLAC